MDDRELFKGYVWKDDGVDFSFTWEDLTLSELLYHYRTTNMCIMGKHNSEQRKDIFRARAKRIHDIIVERYGEE